MSTLSDRLDRFVRWFFNCSPTTTLIEVDEAGPARPVGRARRHHADKAPAPRDRHNVRRSRSNHQERARA